MQPSQLGLEYVSILPEIITAVAAIVIMMAGALAPKSGRKAGGFISLVSLAGALWAVFHLWKGLAQPARPGELSGGAASPSSFGGMIVNDEFRLIFAFVFLLVTFLTVLISLHWIEEEALPGPEYFALLMFATTGMLLMAAAGDLVIIFLGLEITSISTYVLCGYRRTDTRSNESAVKYFILGSFSTAFLLFGIALVYGASFDPAASPVATTNLALLRDRIASEHLFSHTLLFAGAAMMIVGLGFKVSTAPFHIWSPDVYEGAPTPVTAFLSTGSKAAAFSAFARVFILTFAAASVAAPDKIGPPQLQVATTHALYVMAVLTMVIGNVVAIVQSNIKRMLAYSSIAHAGYALIGIVAQDWRAVAFYMMSYVLINIGAFAVIELIARKGDKRTEIEDYSGIGFHSLGLASALSLFLLSLAGIPLTAGFMAKLIIFKSAWGAGFHWLVLIAVINSAISWYYYLRVIVVMFFREPAKDYSRPAVPITLAAALVIIAISTTIFMGIRPDLVLSRIDAPSDRASSEAVLK